jgi:flagellar protein FliL
MGERNQRMASKPKKAELEEEEAAEAADAEEGEGSPRKRKLPLKLIAMVISGVGALGGGGVGAYWLWTGKETKVEVAAVKPPVFVDVPEVLVNLANTAPDRTQYLKVKIVLEVPEAALTPQIQATMPRVMDAFQTYLRELRPTDLDGSAGLYRLKEELTRRVNAAIAPSRITAVLFKEIVVQ